MLSVSGGIGRGFLAPVAYFAEQLVAGLCLYSAGRKPAWGDAEICEPGCHDVAGRSLARCELEFCDLGRVAWKRAGGESPLAGFQKKEGGWHSGVALGGSVGAYVGLGVDSGVCDALLGAVPGGIVRGYGEGL